MSRGHPAGEAKTETHPALIIGLSHRIRYGGDGFMRAMARIALNHLAVAYPDLARQPSLEPLKSYIRQGESRRGQKFTWHSFATAKAMHLPSSSPFAHWVCITKRSDIKRLQGAVVLFRAFPVAVDFGPYDGTDSETVVFKIDPFAELPDDRTWFLLSGSAAPIVPDLPITKFEMLRAVHFFSRKVSMWKWWQSAGEFVSRLNAERTRPAATRGAAIAALLEPERQRILDLLDATIYSIPNIFDWKRRRKAKIQVLRRLLSARRGYPFELSPRTLHLVEALRRKIAQELSRMLVYRPLKLEDVWLLLSGLDGVALAIPIILRAAGLRVRSRSIEELSRGMTAAWSVNGDPGLF
jgi:hypothetical protein